MLHSHIRALLAGKSESSSAGFVSELSWGGVQGVLSDLETVLLDRGLVEAVILILFSIW